MALKIFNKETKGQEKLEKEEKKTPRKTAKKIKTRTASDTGKKESKEHKSVPFGVSGILRKPHVTEKASMLAERNRYVFVVSAAATKGNIKEAVRATYGVSPVHVNIVNIPAKKIRVGRRAGIKKGYKKAIVQLPEGQKIDILPT